MLSALLGIGAAMVLFRYDGTRPINVLWVVLVFVALPLATAVVSAVGMLIGWPKATWMPGAGAWSWLWQRLSRGAWASAGTTARALAQSHAKVLRRGLLAHGWWVGQCVGLTFVVAGAATFGILLATSDLAFGWSSTLDISTEKLADAFRAAFWFAPAWAPDAAMLDATVAERATPFADRYTEDPAAFKAWWRPVLVLVLAYGVAPRLLLTGIAGLRRSRAVSRALASHPAFHEIDARMTTPFVESADGALHRDTTEPSGVPVIQAFPTVDSVLSSDGSTRTRWLSWAEAPLPREATAPLADVLAVGGEATLESDRQAIETLAGERGDTTTRIAVKAWEPPLAEFTDWLKALRERIGDGRPVEVVAMLRGDADHDKSGVWRRALDRLGDPWLRVYAAPIETEAGT